MDQWGCNVTSPPSLGGSGLSAWRLRHLSPAVRALPEGPSGVPPNYGDCFICLPASVSPAAALDCGTLFWPVLNNQPHNGPLPYWITLGAVSVLEARLCSQRISEPLFIITATMSEGWKASASPPAFGETKICKMDNRIIMWLVVGLNFYFLLLTWHSCRAFFYVCVRALFSLPSFVNRLSKDLVGAAVQAQL